MKAHTTIVRDIADHHEGPPDGIRLLVIGRDSYETYDLPSAGTVTIGRSDTNDVQVDDAQASRSHARLIIGGSSLVLEDLGSVNGTRVRDRPVARGERVVIQPGETIAIGSSVLIVHVRPLPISAPVRADRSARPHSSAHSFRDGGPDDAMRSIHHLAKRAAAGTINVLILGETGVGKDVMAEAIHQLSPRSDGPYVCLNCAAIADTLLETELFGHERGAFSGASTAKAGLLETAAGGTLFLDEVGELPAALQVKLLRVLETREVRRVGSVRPRQIDVRFLAATNRDLEAEVERGSFRRDLYFRLNGISIQIPPLRERRSEIQPLAETFLRRICQHLARPEPRISPGVLQALQRHDWPGNIRELRNVIERAVLLCGGSEIGVEHLPEERARKPTFAPEMDRPDRTDRFAPSTAVDKQRILDALARCAGNQSRAAKLLGMPRRTFVARLDRYHIARPKKGDGHSA